ncbi:MAG: ribonuclease III [Eubacteriales bacterium]|jgi:ribonuclease-3
METGRVKDFGELEKAIGYTFGDKSLLVNALTHASYCNENRTAEGALPSNERLEFLGDSVLSIIVSDYIYKNYRSFDEGDLTKIRAAVVCESTLAGFAKSISLGDYILLGKGEEASDGRKRKSILSDAFEALIAAVYLDGGIEKARDFLLPKVAEAAKISMKKGTEDYKSRLQRLAQETPEELLEYVLISEEGPPHDKRFTIEARLNSNVLGVGTGKSKREAEQQAAKKALELFGEIYTENET